MKTLKILIALLIILTLNGYSQNFTFTYDDSGNRVSRIIAPSTKSEIIDADIVENSNEEVIEEEDELIDMMSEIDLLIYPNPTNGEITLVVSGKEQILSASYTLFDITGKEVLSGNIKSNLSQINLEKQLPGIYSLRANIDGDIKYYKIVKE